MESFDNIYKENIGIIHKITQKLIKNPKFKHIDYEDLFQVVTHAAWIGWGYMNRHTLEDGQPRYRLGTYISNCVNKAMAKYPDLFPSNVYEISFDVPDKENIYEGIELKDLMDSKLTPFEKDIINLRIVAGDTLKECGQKYNVAPETVRQWQIKALGKLQDV